MKPIVLQIDDIAFKRYIRVEKYLEVESQCCDKADYIRVIFREVENGETQDRSHCKILDSEYFQIHRDDDKEYIPAGEYFEQISSYISVDTAEALGDILAKEVARCLSTDNNILSTNAIRKICREAIPTIRLKLLKDFAEGKIEYDLE